MVYRHQIDGHEVLIRYPERTDVNIMHKYINALSKEKTYISFQGENISLKEEEKYLRENLKNIDDKKMVQILLFVDGKFAGISEIKFGEMVNKHVGNLGISIAKGFRGKGMGKLIMRTILKEAKKVAPSLKIVTLQVFSNNNIGRGMYKKFGFKEIGLLPKGILYKGSYIDDIMMYKEVYGAT